MKNRILLAAALLPVYAAVADEPGLVFYAPFDKHRVDAVVAKGSPDSSFKQSIELRNFPGVKGGALMLEDGERCEYDLQGNLNPRQGAITCWFKPVNWDGSDRLFHHLICINDKKTPTSWYIYKYTYPRHLNFYVARGSGNDQIRTYCGTSMEKWTRDQWHHVAVTWNAEEMRLYADGRPEGRQRVPEGFFPDKVDGVLSVSPVHYWKNKWSSPESRTLIDEVRVYDRVLSPREVLEMFEALNPYANAGDREPSLAVTLKPDVAARELRVVVAALHLDAAWEEALTQKAAVSVAVAEPNGRRTAHTVPLARDMAIAVPVDQWLDGDYKARATVSAGERVLTADAVLRKPPTPWLDVKPGREFLDVVLPRFTPLQRDGDRLTCWGRAVRFGRGPFPVAVESRKSDLLRAPIVLRGQIDGRAFVLEAPTKIAGADDCRATLAGSQDLGPATARWTGLMEFDGMVRADVTIVPKKKATVEALRLEIPLAKHFVRYIRTAKRRDWTGDRFESAFLNYVWVGDEDRGLCWFMESDANFSIGPGSPVVVVDRATGDACVTIVSRPAAFDKPLSYTIGFQATPLKPLPAGWQAWRLAHTGFKHANMVTHGWGASCYTLAGSLVPPDVDRHVKNLAKWHKQGCKIYSYTCCGCAPDLYEEWPFFEAEWFCAYGSTFVGYKRWGDDAPYSLRSVCVGSSYADFLVGRVENLLRNGWADGLYTDIDHFVGCDNALHDCGYSDVFGRTGKTVPIYRHRDLSKRLYGVCHKYGGLYLSHNHNVFIPPYHAFIDGWCPGEQLSVAVMGKHSFYMDGLSLDDWRAEYYSPATGVVTFMLAQWGRLSPKEDQKIRFPTENLIAMAALHNVPLWANFTNKDVVDEYWAVQKAFGVDDAEFHPYWESPPVTTPTPNVRISVFTKPGRMLAVVVNFSDTDQPVSLHFARPPKECVAAMPRDVQLTSQSGRDTWRAPVRAKNFVLVDVGY